MVAWCFEHCFLVWGAFWAVFSGAHSVWLRFKGDQGSRNPKSSPLGLPPRLRELQTGPGCARWPGVSTLWSVETLWDALRRMLDARRTVCRLERRFRFCISAGSSCIGLLQVLSVVALASAVLVLPNINEFTSARRLPGTFLAVLVLRLRTIQVEERFAHFWVFGEGFTPVWRDV